MGRPVKPIPSLLSFIFEIVVGLFVQVFGQVYIPVINHVLMGLTMIVVGIFQTSARLGNAYGNLYSYAYQECAVDEQLLQ